MMRVQSPDWILEVSQTPSMSELVLRDFKLTFVPNSSVSFELSAEISSKRRTVFGPGHNFGFSQND